MSSSIQRGNSCGGNSKEEEEEGEEKEASASVALSLKFSRLRMFKAKRLTREVVDERSGLASRKEARGMVRTLLCPKFKKSHMALGISQESICPRYITV